MLHYILALIWSVYFVFLSLSLLLHSSHSLTAPCVLPLRCGLFSPMLGKNTLQLRGMKKPPPPPPFPPLSSSHLASYPFLYFSLSSSTLPSLFDMYPFIPLFPNCFSSPLSYIHVFSLCQKTSLTSDSRGLRSPLTAASNPSMHQASGTPSSERQRFYLEAFTDSSDWGRVSVLASTTQTGRLY